MRTVVVASRIPFQLVVIGEDRFWRLSVVRCPYCWVDRWFRSVWTDLLLFLLSSGLDIWEIDLCWLVSGSDYYGILYLGGILGEFRSSSRIRLTRVDQGGFLVYPGVYVSGKQVSGSRKLNLFFKSSFGSLSSFWEDSWKTLGILLDSWKLLVAVVTSRKLPDAAEDSLMFPLFWPDCWMIYHIYVTWVTRNDLLSYPFNDTRHSKITTAVIT